MEWWLQFFGWFLTFLTVLGNCSVILLISINRRLYCSANWFVLSLAVADFAVGAAVFPMGYICKYATNCNMRLFVAFYWFFLHSSTTNLCALILDRYIILVYPFKYPTSMVARKPGTVIVFSWFIPLTISTSLVLGPYATRSPVFLKVLHITGVSGLEIISCLLLFYAVVRILLVQAKQNYAMKSIERQIRHNQALIRSSIPRRRKRASAVGFVIAIALFCFGCYVIVNYLILCLSFSCSSLSYHDHEELVSICTLLLIGNSAVNPLVYALLKRDIKRELRQLFHRQVKHITKSRRSAILLNVIWIFFVNQLIPIF